MIAGLQIQRLFPAAACCPTPPRPRPRARILANPARNPTKAPTKNVTQCGICGASAQDRRLAIFDLRFKLSLHGADSGACSPASSSSALASSRVCLGRSRGLAAGAQAARAARYMGRKTCWGSETGYYYLRHATHRLALPQSAHRVAVALSACIAVVSSR